MSSPYEAVVNPAPIRGPVLVEEIEPSPPPSAGARPASSGGPPLATPESVLAPGVDTPFSTSSTKPLLPHMNSTTSGSSTISSQSLDLSSLSEPLNVLVVDDDSLTRSLMSRMLTRLGCHVETAFDGVNALDILLGNISEDRAPRQFDLITLDNHMPTMSGEEAVRELRRAGRQDYAIGCTGNALKSDTEAFIQAGVHAVLTKPILLKDLKTLLHVAITRRTPMEIVEQDEPEADEP